MAHINTMPRRSTDHLIKLVKRLTPSEKRQFKLYATKKGAKNDLLFLALFDVLDKSKEYDERKILKKIPQIKKEQLPNLKSHLYKQLLTSLRLQKRHTHPSIVIREQIDYALVLHSKGLYNAALDTLEKAKKMASESDRSISVLSAIEIEKHIESLYITGSMYPKAKLLKEQTNRAIKQISINHELSNLSLSLYGLYLQYGYVKDDKDFDFITDYFKKHLPDVDVMTLDFYGKVHLYQSHVWYYNMVHDFINTYKYAQKWVDLFLKDAPWQKRELTLYIKGLHNVLNSLFMAQRYDKFAPMYEALLKLGDEQLPSMNRDQASTFKLFEYMHGINQFFLAGNFLGGTQYVKQIAEAIESNKWDWDLNRVMMFHYKIASLYFVYGDLDRTIYHLHKITNEVYPNFREDIQCFARVLNLIAHFDLGNQSLVTYQVKSTYRFLSKMANLQPALKLILLFVRKIPSIKEEDLKEEFSLLNEDLKEIRRKKFERRPFLYLDIISWLESKIEDVPVGEVVLKKLKRRTKQVMPA